MAGSPASPEDPPATDSPTLPPPDERSPAASDALTATGRVLRDLPGAIIPAYLLALGVASVARVPILLALALSVGLLDRAGRIEPLLREARAISESGVDPGSVPPEVAAMFRDLFTPTVIALLVGGVLAGIVVLVLARAVSTAVTQTTVWATLAVGSGVGPGSDVAPASGGGSGEGTPAERALTAGVRGAGRWRTFLGLFLLKLLVVAVCLGIPAALTAGLAVVSGVAAVVGGLLLAVGGLVTIVAFLLLSFAGPAIVVDDAGALAAAKRSVAFVRRHVGVSIAFVLLAGGLYVGAAVLSGLTSVVGAGRLGGLFVPLVVSPLIDLLATGLYAGVSTTDDVVPREATAPDDTATAADTGRGTTDSTARGTTDSTARGAAGDTTETASTAGTVDLTETADDSGFQWLRASDETASESDRTTRAARPRGVVVPNRQRAPLRTRLRNLFGDGLRSSLAVVGRHPLAVGVALLAFVLGTVGGWTLTASAGIAIDPPGDVSGVFGPLPVNDFLNIAANNWLVAASGTYSGLAFALPALTAAAFNGALVGALAGVFDRVAFLALVAPHGVIEIPTLLLAWGLGVHLGTVGWRAVRGQTDAATVAGHLRRAARALAGIAVLLVVASFVEAFLTPWIAARIVG